METKIRPYKKVCLHVLNDVIKMYNEDPIAFKEELKITIIEELKVENVDYIFPFYENIIKELSSYPDLENLTYDLSHFERYQDEKECDNMSEYKHAFMDSMAKDILKNINEPIELKRHDQDIINIICSLCSNTSRCKVCLKVKSLV